MRTKSKFKVGEAVRVTAWVPGGYPTGAVGRVLTVQRVAPRQYRYRVSSENAASLAGCSAWYDEDCLEAAKKAKKYRGHISLMLGEEVFAHTYTKRFDSREEAEAAMAKYTDSDTAREDIESGWIRMEIVELDG